MVKEDPETMLIVKLEFNSLSELSIVQVLGSSEAPYIVHICCPSFSIDSLLSLFLKHAFPSQLLELS